MRVTAGQMFARLFSFRGRVSRAEFWTVLALAGLCLLPAFATEFRWLFWDAVTQSYIVTETSLISGTPTRYEETVVRYVFTLFSVSPTWVTIVPLLVVIAPLLAALSRRLHDLGRPAWWGWVALFLIFVLRSLFAMLYIVIFAVSPVAAFVVAIIMSFPTFLLSAAALIVLVLWTANEGDLEDNQYGLCNAGLLT